ncbi:MAG: ROK family protein [Haliscomenobacter sp.]|nr:ROK family protein [Haliscomenobacter sp.]MBK7477166.1 ROK family protein [Haliscomenobacter sp.]
MKPLWGIDMGGTKIEGVILRDKDDPEVLTRLRVPTEKEGGYEHIIGQIGKLVDLMHRESGLQPGIIGMGHPGALDPQTQTMKNSNTTVVNGMPFKRDLEAALGIPFVLANDANCFAVAEANMGAVKTHMPDARIVFGVIMGTGVGGGIVIDGKVWNGRQGIGGEWGHSYLDDSGGVCYCGKTGCVETLLCGPATERYYAGINGVRRPLPEIVQRYDAGDPAAVETLDRLMHFFGKGMSNVINILDPDVIVLGGGVGNMNLLYSAGVEKVKKFVFNLRLDTVFLRPELGDSAGVFGAAYLVA